MLPPRGHSSPERRPKWSPLTCMITALFTGSPEPGVKWMSPVTPVYPEIAPIASRNACRSGAVALRIASNNSPNASYVSAATSSGVLPYFCW